MEWFKVYADLKGHPKRYRFEAACGTKHGLHYIVAFWSYVCKYAPDGNLTRMTPAEIAGACEWQGDPQVFFASLIEAGFVDETRSGFEVHDWVEEHKRFIDENKRRKEDKKPKGYPRVTQGLPAKTQGLPAKTQGLPSLEEKRIEEKEEKRKIPKPLSGADAPGFETFWQAYPKRTGKGACARIWARKKPPLDTCLATLAWQKRSEQWTKEGGQFVPLPATWLNQDRWLDEKESGRGSGTGDGGSTTKYTLDDGML